MQPQQQAHHHHQGAEQQRPQATGQIFKGNWMPIHGAQALLIRQLLRCPCRVLREN